jgi:hypothetical protein
MPDSLTLKKLNKNGRFCGTLNDKGCQEQNSRQPMETEDEAN